MNIAIIGSGYVGLVTGACFAELGNRVICVDNDAKKIAGLRKGLMPIFEPGLKEFVGKNMKKKRLAFSTDIKEAVGKSEIIFIAVGTPSLENGEADLTYIENVARSIAKSLSGYKLIVEKSTVPVETGMHVKETIAQYVHRKVDFDVASNPEFLREGQAIQDFLHPDRVVIGVESKRAQNLLTELYRPLNAKILVTDIKSAELIKHASNAFLATKISFINAVSRVCDAVGADVRQVALGMGLDKRIGQSFLNAGLGYGGSCFPKDLDAFITIAEKRGYRFDLLHAVRAVNEEQRQVVYKKIKDTLWIIKDKTIAVLGLSFKPNTDDMRNAPAVDLIRLLQAEGAKVRVYDPCAVSKAREVLDKVAWCKDPYHAATGSDCLVVATEWDEFKELDLVRIKKVMKRPVLLDARNIYDPLLLKRSGFTYIGIGRGTHG